MACRNSPGNREAGVSVGLTPQTGTHHFLGQGEHQVLQVVLMAQGPGRAGCELWGRPRSHTLEKVVLESRGSQHCSQLKRQVCSDLESDSNVS